MTVDPEYEPLRAPEGAVEITYESGARTLKAYATPVMGFVRKPALLFLHGGFSFGQGHWELTRPFRRAGYVVLVPTLRGENGQDGERSLFLDEVDDVLAAAAVLQGRVDVDPRRVFVAGHSVGGTLAMLAALASPKFRAAASFSGSPDQVVYTRGRPERIPFDPRNLEEFRIRSPVAFATFFQCPTRLYFGDEEFWLQPSTIRAARLARDAGLDVEAVEIPGGHDSALPEEIRRCLDFFREQ
jgi:dipeptidyl aminopeptidase/acylaminoacyl peptidase